jgi:hypothetical protein
MGEPLTWGELRDLAEGLPDSALVQVVAPVGEEAWDAVPFDVTGHLAPGKPLLLIELEVSVSAPSNGS